MTDIDPIVKTAVDAWLGEVENFGLRAERVPEGALPWLYEAAMVGVDAVREAEIQRATRATKAAIMRDEEAQSQRTRATIFPTSGTWSNSRRHPVLLAA